MRLTIENCQKWAEKKGGKFLSKTYEKNSINYRWECKNGHRWWAKFSNVKSGTWCRKCMADSYRSDIEDCHKTAKQNGGKCLSKIYTNSKIKLQWECKQEHCWKAHLNSIKSGSWCPECYHIERRNRNTIEDCHEVAASKGGRCLSKNYKDSRTNMKWQCGQGHTWKATYNRVQQSSWCPHCHTYKSEEEVRAIIEKLTRRKFPPAKPDWLHGLKLDGYNKNLAIAFEYQGQQHYKPSWRRTDPIQAQEDLVKQKRYDNRKKFQCWYHGVKLIRIPYYIKNMESYLSKRL